MGEAYQGSLCTDSDLELVDFDSLPNELLMPNELEVLDVHGQLSDQPLSAYITDHDPPNALLLDSSPSTFPATSTSIGTSSAVHPLLPADVGISGSLAH